ncbi:DUF4363 family protein [Virgibacillus sp. LDC-1]|uniref:DUF4363 family protein n=1 Tax=Virgibacillus sp. LDC-1 TaxID=3039856 RepID=UPI0024DEDD07|nr:DUF4363 family protein [Virgibacillus sp. LDC-1]
MKKGWLKIIPIIVLAVFIFIMTSGAFLKQPLWGDDDVIHYIKQVEGSVKENDWKNATESLKKAQHAWNKVVMRIQFNAGQDEINDISRMLERAHGHIDAKDQIGVIAEMAEFRYVWAEIGH